jgi:filamentous hemagglutinin
MIVINSAGGDVTGYWSVSGNVTGGNLITGGIASITGTATAGNVATGGTVSATGNVTGGNILTGGAVSATGTATAGNFDTAGNVSATGNVTGGNLVTAGVATVTGNVIGGNITTAGLVTATGNVIGGNLVTAGLATVTGNVIGGNILTAGIVSAGGNVAGNNITAADRVSAIGNVISDSALVSALVGSSGGITIQSLSAGDITLDAAGNIDADNNYINNVLYPVQDTDAATKLYVDNMVSTAISYHEAVYAATTANLATTTGGTITYNQPNGAGNGIGATITTTGAFNLIDTANVQTANTRILVKDEGNAVLNGIYVWSNATVITRSSDADTYAPATANALSVNDYFFVQEGNVNKGTAWIVDEPTGNITFGTSNIAFAQFSSSQTYTANTQAGLVLNGTVFSAKVDNDTTAFDGGGNIIVKAGANLVTPNIGAATGTSLSLTGNLVSGNVNTGGVISATGNITGNYFIGNGSQLTGVTASSVDANNLVGNTLSANVVNSSLTSVGNLTTLSVVGTTTTGNLDTAGAVSAIGNVTGGNLLTGGVISATGTATVGNLATGGTISATGTATVGNLDTGGTVSATGNVTGGNLITSGIATITGTVTAGNVDTGGTVSATGNVTGGNVLTGGLVSATGNVTGGNLLTAGVLSAGGNVTSANVNTGNVSATGNITAVNYTGTSVSVTGNVTAANFIGNISGNIDAGGANTEVQFNDGDLLNGSANFTFDKATNIMSVTGTIEGTTVSATGNVIAGNVSTAGLVTATGNVTGGNLVTGGLITATGAVTAANLVLTSGTFDGPAGGIINVNGSASDTDFAVNGNTSANVFYVDAGLGTTSFGNSGAITNAIVSFNTTDSVLLPRGNTAQRPAPATVGMFRFNTTSDALEVYNSGSGWTTVEQDFTVIVADSFTGNGVQTIFTLSEDSTTAGTIVSINGVVQIPTTAYSVSGNALTFTEAPSVSDTIDARILTTSTTVASLTNASGNASVECLDAADTVQIEGNLLPSANVTYNLGSPTAMWNDAYFAGNTIYLGNLQLKQADATTFAVYTNDGVTQANIDVGSVDVSSIISGTTVIGIGAPNGNAYLAPAGSNALVAASTGVFVTGLMSATGNITGNYILGNGSQLTGIDATSIQSGTSNVRVLSSGGNVSAGIGGTGNVLVLATTGAYVTGLASVTGNVIAGNLSGTNIVGTLTTAAQTNITSVGTLTSLSVTGNVTAGNLSVGQGTVNVGNIVNTNANGVGNIGSSSLYFNTVFAKATSAQYADLAEMYEADGVIESGTVVEFGGAREVTACGTDGSKRIAGVVSTNPSYIMNAGLQGDNVVAVALTGRVPVKVTGTVRKGDMMVAAGGGRARAEANPAVGSVIGKALADFDGAEGTIEVVVGRL